MSAASVTWRCVAHQRSLGRRDIAGELVVEGLRPDDELVPADGDRVGGERLAERAAGEPGRQLQCALPLFGCERVDVDDRDHGVVVAAASVITMPP